MEKIKNRAKKYEVTLKLKSNGYYIARISLGIGVGASPRLEKSGTTAENALLNLLNELILYIDVSFSSGLITVKIDDLVPHRLVSSINNLGIISSEITERALIVVNKINYINNCILNNIQPNSNIIPLCSQQNKFQISTATQHYNQQSFELSTISNVQNSNSFVVNKPVEQCIVADLVNEWFKYRLSLCIKTKDNPKPLSQNTVDNNFDRLRDDILPYFKKNKILYLAQVTEEIIRGLLKSITCQNSKHKSYVVLNMIFKYAIKHNKATYNPMNNVEKPPEKIITGEEKFVQDWIEPEDQEKWLDLFEDENTDMSLLFETLLVAGLRPECGCGLKWTSLDEESCELDINNAHKSFNVYNEDRTKIIGHERRDAKLKTPQSYRIVPIPQRLVDVLLKHKKKQQELFKTSRALKAQHRKWSENEYIFLGRNYHPYVPESLANGLTDFENKYGLTTKDVKVTPYGLRKSFATYWADKGMKEEILMRLMGHSNYETTVKHYIKVSTKQIREEMQRVSKAS